MNNAVQEPILEPELPIVDAHHHLWVQPESMLKTLDQATSIGGRSLAGVYRRNARYTLDEFLADAHTGHNVRASVFVECHAMYKKSGPDTFKSVGEVEFVNGIAAMADSGIFGDTRAAAAIVGGGVDLAMGDGVQDILRAHINAGGGRYRGLRSWVFWDADQEVSGGHGKPHQLMDEKFRAGLRHLHPLGLSFDCFVLEPQLPELIDVARAFPDLQIVVNHLATPLGVGRYAGKLQERFPIWRDNMRTLAKCQNVTMKLGGIGMFYAGFGYFDSKTPVTSQRMADDWRPYIETCVEAFGANRCMFESNFPVDSASCSYATLWNAFKRLASGASKTEKEALFAKTAARVYRIELA